MGKTFAIGHGMRVTDARLTAQDALDNFKKAVVAGGGTWSQTAHDEIVVTGAISSKALHDATVKLKQDLASVPVPQSPLADALKRFGKAVGVEPAKVDRTVDQAFAQGDYVIASYPLPFGFPSFEFVMSHAEPGVVAAKTAKTVAKALKPKLVKDVAPTALSTWDFQTGYLQRMHGIEVSLVGHHYRPRADQDVLGWKNVGNMALLVAEPDNPVDLNAVMVLVWNDVEKRWVHAGYVRATQAATLRGKWTGDFKNVMVARITSKPKNYDGHRGGNNIGLTLTGEVRTYPGYKL